MSEATHCLITNLRAQPLELHLAERVLVLEPYGQVDITEVELSSPQITNLRDRHLVRVQQVTEQKLAHQLEHQSNQASQLEPSNQGESGHEL